MSMKGNREVVRRYFEEFHSERRREILPEIIGESLQAPTEGATNALAAAFPDYRIHIEAQVADGDLVATVWRGEGTHSGEWQSPIGPVPATGKKVTFSATTTLRITEGRISEVVGSNWDHLGILQQLGAVPSIAPRPGA